MGGVLRWGGGGIIGLKKRIEAAKRQERKYAKRHG